MPIGPTRAEAGQSAGPGLGPGPWPISSARSWLSDCQGSARRLGLGRSTTSAPSCGPFSESTCAEESRDLTPTANLADFTMASKTSRDAVERLEARIERLARTAGGNEGRGQEARGARGHGENGRASPELIAHVLRLTFACQSTVVFAATPRHDEPFAPSFASGAHRSRAGALSPDEVMPARFRSGRRRRSLATSAAAMARGERLRRSLEELGPIFVKGSGRSCPPVVICCQRGCGPTNWENRVAPLSWCREARALIEAELGASIGTH